METFIDDEGNSFDLNSEVYTPRQMYVNSAIIESVGRQLVRGSFRDF